MTAKTPEYAEAVAPGLQPTQSAMDELRAAQEAEYGTYVAVEPIDVGNARAFNPGDSVPVSHVKNGVVSSSQVAKRQ